MIRYLFTNFSIKNLGVLELLFAFYLILSGYSFGPISLSWGLLIVMDIIALKRKKGLLKCSPLLILISFVVIHTIILVFFMPSVPSYYWNIRISLLLYLISIFIIVPAINYDRMISALDIVAIISSLGILYHFLILKAGGTINPIKVPFLPLPNNDSRLFEDMDRPCSFYWEPAAYISYMLVPLYIALYKRRYYMVFIFIFFIFLSTSSTGIILSVLMSLTFVLSQKTKKQSKILLLILTIVLVWAFLSFSWFNQGLEKIQTTDLESTARIMNGPTLINSMPLSHLLLGMNSANINDYYNINPVMKDAYLIVNSKDGIFLSTFWRVWSTFGVAGLCIYLSLYIYVIRKNRLLFPYILVLLIALFVQGHMFSSIFVYQFIFILSFLNCNSITLSNVSCLGKAIK